MNQTRRRPIQSIDPPCAPIPGINKLLFSIDVESPAFASSAWLAPITILYVLQLSQVFK